MKNKIAIVTGASRGIGRAISLLLAERGATVVACARSRDALEELAAEGRKRELGGAIDPRTLDVSDRTVHEKLARVPAKAHGRPPASDRSHRGGWSSRAPNACPRSRGS